MTAVLSDNSMRILEKRYLEPNETVNHMFHRVAGGDERFEKIMTDLDFLPNSPTLMNAGTKHEGKSTFSACFKFDVADTMLEGEDSIIETLRKATGVAKWGGGVGYYFGDLRAKNKPIRSVHRVACGPINVLKTYNLIGMNLITQGGRRELAQMGILPVDHDDIREFIHVKDKDPQALRTFNISVATHDEFMRSVFQNGNVKATELWNEIVDSAWKTGDPGLYFNDTAELHNPTPHLGKLTGTNPCGEVPLLNNEPCNLGSLNLANFVTNQREIDWCTLEDVTRIAIQFLDNILDRNTFPHPAITKAAYLTRKLGLGVMGWAGMLSLMHVHYDTSEAAALAESVSRFINEIAADESLRLGREKGPYPGCKDDKPYRNATRTCIAPTGTISILADAMGSSIEPFFALEQDRVLNKGVEGKEETIHEYIPRWEELEGFVPKTTNEIHYTWHVRHQAAWQKNVDLAVSKTINLPNSATRQDISDAYKLMWESGCKGGTIFRDGCRGASGQVLNATPKASTNGNSNGHTYVLAKREEVLNAATEPTSIAHGGIGPTVINLSGLDRIVLPDAPTDHRPAKIRKALINHMRIGEYEGYLHAGMRNDGSLCEIFITSSKEGSTVAGLLDSWAIAVSFYLQGGGSLERLVRKYSGMRFEPNGRTNDENIPICTSIQDYVVRWLDMKFGEGRNDLNHKGMEVHSGMLCPDCNGPAVYQGGCLTCKNRCGWSRCG
jgi:ribonucleoside-diphosphate reductase alpha chain